MEHDTQIHPHQYGIWTRDIQRSIGSMQYIFPTASQLAFRMMVPVLTPHHDPTIVHQVLLHNIPTADLSKSNTLSNSDTLSSLSYALATSPESSHGWLVFKLVQWEALKASAGTNTTITPDSSPFTFPPSPSTTDMSKPILEYWMALDQGEILEWEELARDIRSAYAQLVARFGKGTQFDGITWEEQRYYVARCLFLKWMGHQAMQNMSARNDSASTYLLASLAQTMSAQYLGVARSHL